MWIRRLSSPAPEADAFEVVAVWTRFTGSRFSLDSNELMFVPALCLPPAASQQLPFLPLSSRVADPYGFLRDAQAMGRVLCAGDFNADMGA